MASPYVYRIHVLDVRKTLVTHVGEMTLHLEDVISVNDVENLAMYVVAEHFTPLIEKGDLETALREERVCFGLAASDPSISWNDNSDRIGWANLP